MRLLINHVSEVKSNWNARKFYLVSSSICWTDQLNSHFESIEIKSVCKDSVLKTTDLSQDKIQIYHIYFE